MQRLAPSRSFPTAPGADGLRVVLYTCTFLAYDQIFSPVRTTPGLDYVLVADRRPRFVRGWQWRALPPETRALSQAMTNRYCKFFPHRLFPEADCSIYVDANTLILGDLTPLIAEFVASGADIGLFEHKERGNIADELAFAKTVGKVPPEDFALGAAQVAAYFEAGLPRDHAFTENAIVFRRHGSPALDAAMRLWWDEINTYTKRDQISLPYVLYRSGLKTKIWNWNYKRKNAYFKRYLHKRGVRKNIFTFIDNKSFYGNMNRHFFTFLLRLARRMVKSETSGR